MTFQCRHLHRKKERKRREKEAERAERDERERRKAAERAAKKREAREQREQPWGGAPIPMPMRRDREVRSDSSSRVLTELLIIDAFG